MEARRFCLWKCSCTEPGCRNPAPPTPRRQENADLCPITRNDNRRVAREPEAVGTGAYGRDVSEWTVKGLRTYYTFPKKGLFGKDDNIRNNKINAKTGNQQEGS